MCVRFCVLVGGGGGGGQEGENQVEMGISMQLGSLTSQIAKTAKSQLRQTPSGMCFGLMVTQSTWSAAK